MKKILIILALFILIAAGATAFLYWKNQNSAGNQGGQGGSVSQSGSGSIPAAPEVEYADPFEGALAPPDQYGNVLMAEGSEYDIQYFSKDKEFHISLFSHNLRDARVAAENKLLEKLKITKEEACRIPVYVGTPLSFSEEFSGRNLGLSFCPNRVDLPRGEVAQ